MGDDSSDSLPAVGSGNSSNGNGTPFGTPEFSNFGAPAASTSSVDAKDMVQSRADACKGD